RPARAAGVQRAMRISEAAVGDRGNGSGGVSGTGQGELASRVAARSAHHRRSNHDSPDRPPNRTGAARYGGRGQYSGSRSAGEDAQPHGGGAKRGGAFGG